MIPEPFRTAFVDAVPAELVKFLFWCLGLLVTYFFGMRIVTAWDLRKKRQELDIALAGHFQKLYGEFKDIWRMWKMFKYEGSDRVAFDPSLRAGLLQRATTTEGGIEALVLKLATERLLTPEQLHEIGLFRQGFQRLRESIRDDEPLRWSHSEPEYVLLNELACKLAVIIAAPHRKVKQNWIALAAITQIRSADWKKAVTEAPR